MALHSALKNVVICTSVPYNNQCRPFKKNCCLFLPQVPRGQELALDLLPSPAPSPANLLIPQQAKPVAAANLLQQLPSISVHSQLVTPTATWTELLSTTSYQTTITQTETSEVPILWRGKKIVTTIYDTNTQVVQATEIKTSSVLITPAPTWSTTTVTVTPSPIVPVNQACFYRTPHHAFCTTAFYWVFKVTSHKTFVISEVGM